MDSDLKLLGLNKSMFTFRVIWALKLKGIEYDFIEKELFKPCPLLLQYNPVHKLAPVLIHGGKPICESSVVLEYIDETWKQRPLFPQDPLQRAHVRLWASFADDKIVEASQKAFSSGEEQAKACNVMREALKLLDEEINGKKFFGGEEIGYLDLMLGWIAHWLQVSEEVGEYKAMDSAKFPSLKSGLIIFFRIPPSRTTYLRLMSCAKTSMSSKGFRFLLIKIRKIVMIMEAKSIIVLLS